MSIISFDEKKKIFHLHNDHISYVMQLVAGRYLTQVYFGQALTFSGNIDYPALERAFSPYPADLPSTISLDNLRLEYPGSGFGDYRTPAYDIRYENGTTLTDFRYSRHTITKGKPSLSGLPASFATENSCETLTIYLEDAVTKVQVVLMYSIFEDSAVIARSARISNASSEEIVLEKAASCTLDFYPKAFELIHLPGAWGNERQLTREPITLGARHFGSTRGASSHQENPFIAIVEPETTEKFGQAYGFSLLYSGNHESIIQKDQYGQTRFIMGIHPQGFSWPLASGQSFQTPEVVLSYSASGLNGLSQTLHLFLGEHVIRSPFKKKVRPVLINNWEATYFNFNEEKVLSIAKKAKDLGVELFVLDDGWFGKRDDDRTSLGDWVVDKNKLPNGIEGLAKKVHELGLQFGLWFEPEMVSEKSALFIKHPDWILQAPNRATSLGRSQYVLDFSKAEVRENIYQQMAVLLETGAINYIKWDFNRHLTEVFSQNICAREQGTISHKYVLGLYDFLEKLVTAFPDILFESCSGGGGRFDTGMLYYMPQVWTSDDTDAVARLKIQYGTSLAYPISTMGAHVSAVPNHQLGRVTSIKMRQEVALAGLLGYELDLNKLTDSELDYLKQAIVFYKQHRNLLQYGKFYRLVSPYQGQQAAWQFVSENQDEAMVCCYQIMVTTQDSVTCIPLQGLDEDATYACNGQNYFGSELMHLGLFLPPSDQDFTSQVFYFKKIK